MKLPKIEKTERYQGLYVIDFGEHTGVGFTADEVAELLESERFAHVKVYKIHKAYPDSTMELKGVPLQTFQLESGLFFYAREEAEAQNDFKQLVHLAVSYAPPCRAKVHLARYADGRYVTALIYPAEYDDEVSTWLLEGHHESTGLAEGGVGIVQQYYDRKPDIIERHQLLGRTIHESRTGDALLVGLKQAMQR